MKDQCKFLSYLVGTPSGNNCVRDGRVDWAVGDGFQIDAIKKERGSKLDKILNNI